MASSINIMGTYSGITMDTVDQLIEAESGKLVQYTSQQTELNSEKNAWKDVNTRLTSLFDNFEGLKDAATFDSKTVSNSSESIVKVSSSTDALEGTYKVAVSQLATSSQITSGVIEEMEGKSATDELTLSGSLTIKDADGKLIPLTVKTGESLKDIVTNINETSKEVESGIQASIIDNRIVLMDSNMGDRTIEIIEPEPGTGAGTEGESLSAELALNIGDGKAVLTKGQPAVFKVNGIQIQRDTNTITDAVEGLTFNLVSVSKTDEVSTIKVAEDHDKTTKAVQGFVDQYNSVMDFIGTQLDVGDPSAEGNKTGALVGDSSLMRLQSQLRSILTDYSKDETKPIRGLADLGIEVDRAGKASLDAGKLKEVLAEDSNAVQDFFFKEEAVKDADGKDTKETKEVGMAVKMTTFINEYIGEKTGIITTKAKTIDGMIEDLDKQITRFNERLETKRTRYIEQFTALDVAMMEAESQLSYLMSQIGAVTATNQQA